MRKSNISEGKGVDEVLVCDNDIMEKAIEFAESKKFISATNDFQDKHCHLFQHQVESKLPEENQVSIIDYLDLIRVLCFIPFSYIIRTLVPLQCTITTHPEP
jgi:hypothetical protein